MSSLVHLRTPLTDEAIRALHVGDVVLLSGAIYTARDAAHQRLVNALAAELELPIDLQGQIIYYVGPSPTRPGEIIGSAGPTTAGRVDILTPQLLARGLKGMIGKGKRSLAVREAIQKYGAVYFVLVGGAAALISEHIKKVEVIAYHDLATEAIHRFEIEELRLVVGNDVYGGDLFEQGQAAWRRAEPVA